MRNKMDNLGKFGEEVASKYLKTKGYKIRERNYRTSLGEIDIIGEYKSEIIFVEVKTRSSEQFGLLEEAVNLSKQKKMIKNALGYLTRYHLGKSNTRFDVILISISDHRKVNSIKHIKNAFNLDFSSQKGLV